MYILYKDSLYHYYYYYYYYYYYIVIIIFIIIIITILLYDSLDLGKVGSRLGKFESKTGKDQLERFHTQKKN